MIIEENTPIAALSVSDFRALMKDIARPNSEGKTATPKRYVYGLQGIAELFQCSHLTAQRYKDGILKDACMQSGRKIVVDVDKAMELFSLARKTKGMRYGKK